MIGLSISGAGSIGIEDVKAYGCIYRSGPGGTYPYHHIKNGRIIGEACVNASTYDDTVTVYDEESCGGYVMCLPWYGRWYGKGDVLGDVPRGPWERKVCISNYTKDGKYGFCGTVNDIRNLLH